MSQSHWYYLFSGHFRPFLMRLTTWSLRFRETNRVWFAFHYSWEQSWDLQDTREWGSCGSANHSGHILDLQLCSLPVTKVSTSTVELGSANEDLVVHLVTFGCSNLSSLWSWLVMDTVQSNLVITHFVCSCKSEVHMMAMFGYPIGHARTSLPENVPIIQVSSVDEPSIFR